MEEEEKKINVFEIWENKVVPVLTSVIKYWYIPPILAVLAFVFIYSKERSKKPSFTAKITFMLEDDIMSESQQAGSGSQILMALSGQRTQSNKAVLVDLGLSNKLVEETLITTVEFDSLRIPLVNYFMDHCGYRDIWNEEENKDLIKFNFPKDYEIGSDRNKDYWLRVFSNEIKLTLKSQVMESGLIVMNYTSSNELFTKKFLETHLKTISEFYINKKIERAHSVLKFARRKKDSLQALLSGKTYGLANMQDQGFGVVMRRAKVPEIQVTRDISIINQQYAESVAAVSGASIDLERQKPFISVVDDIRLPLLSTWPKPLNKALVFSILVLILGFAGIAGILLGIDFLKEQKKEFSSS